MTKQEILEFFDDINNAYNESCRLESLSRMLDELLKEHEAVVRCKDCKHRPKEIPFTTTWGETQTYLEFPNDSKCPCWNSSDEYYSWNPDDDWFCADGERKGQ